MCFDNILSDTHTQRLMLENLAKYRILERKLIFNGDVCDVMKLCRI